MDMPNVGYDKKTIDQFSKFLEPTIPKGQEEYFNERKPLISKELSVGNIERADMVGNLDMFDAILEFLEEGQIGLARFFMTRFQGDFKMSMSFEGKFLEHISSNKMEYTQRQDIHEHIERPKKTGIFGGIK